MSDTWQSINDVAAQTFAAEIDGTFEHQALVPLHQGYLEASGVLTLGLLRARLQPQSPVDMLFLYKTVAEAFRLPWVSEVQRSALKVPSWMVNEPQAEAFVSGLASEEVRNILAKFIALCARSDAPGAPLDMLFSCQLLEQTSCRLDVLKAIRSFAIRDELVKQRTFEGWVESWTR